MKKEVKILECNGLDFGGKDMIQLKNKDDFIWLCGETVYKLDNTYYILTSDSAFIYQDEIHKNSR